MSKNMANARRDPSGRCGIAPVPGRLWYIVLASTRQSGNCLRSQVQRRRREHHVQHEQCGRSSGRSRDAGGWHTGWHRDRWLYSKHVRGVPEYSCGAQAPIRRSGRFLWAEVQKAQIETNANIVSRCTGCTVGRLEEGAVADFILVDYASPTSVTSENAFGHMFFGMSPDLVDTVVVNGNVAVKGHRVLGVNREDLERESRKVAKAVGRRLTDCPSFQRASDRNILDIGECGKGPNPCSSIAFPLFHDTI